MDRLLRLRPSPWAYILAVLLWAGPLSNIADAPEGDHISGEALYTPLLNATSATRRVAGVLYSCTATRVEQRWITAAHCTKGQDTVIFGRGQMLLEPVKTSAQKGDVALLFLPAHDRGLTLREKPLFAGLALCAFGHAFGEDPPIIVCDADALASINRQGLVLNLEIIGGMSGGPVVDAEGKLVTIVSGTWCTGDGKFSVCKAGGPLPKDVQQLLKK